MPMMNADVSFLDRLCDRAAHPVNPQHLRCVNTDAQSAAVWTALASYHNAGHRHTHRRKSAGLSSAYIGDKDSWHFIADQDG